MIMIRRSRANKVAAASRATLPAETVEKKAGAAAALLEEESDGAGVSAVIMSEGVSVLSVDGAGGDADSLGAGAVEVSSSEDGDELLSLSFLPEDDDLGDEAGLLLLLLSLSLSPEDDDLGELAEEPEDPEDPEELDGEDLGDGEDELLPLSLLPEDDDELPEEEDLGDGDEEEEPPEELLGDGDDDDLSLSLLSDDDDLGADADGVGADDDLSFLSLSLSFDDDEEEVGASDDDDDEEEEDGEEDGDDDDDELLSLLLRLFESLSSFLDGEGVGLLPESAAATPTMATNTKARTTNSRRAIFLLLSYSPHFSLVILLFYGYISLALCFVLATFGLR
ncbi:unnamed protein product [Prunus armeniaca]|uniref:Uncharacterized protein n=1 Tax=Prunus armeniaca TaxID=36596 RepID=A0A6J5UI41_PRUAR|nr:unnamed protein product [Prunus armeniaca]